MSIWKIFLILAMLMIALDVRITVVIAYAVLLAMRKYVLRLMGLFDA